MDEQNAIVNVGRAIQLSVAPVFLLSAIGAMLAVMTNRLARVVDRARGMEQKLGHATADERRVAERDLAVMSRRARLINVAITLCTITAMLVCAVVAAMFSAAFLGFNAAIPVAILFVAAMITFFCGLLCFLREIFLATANLRIGGVP